MANNYQFSTSGGLSDKFGRRHMLVISFIATPILMFIFVGVGNLWKLPVLVLLGFFIISSVLVFMAIVMENAPNQRAFANSVYMATDLLLNSLGIFLAGLLSDWVGLRLTFLITAVLLPLSCPLCVCSQNR